MTKNFKKGGVEMFKERVKTKIRDVLKFCWDCKWSLLQVGLVGIAVLLQFIPHHAFAWSQPSEGDFGYTIYDVLVNKLAKGPAGAVIAGGSFVGALVAALRSAWVPAGALACLGGVLFSIDKIAQSMGFCV